LVGGGGGGDWACFFLDEVTVKQNGQSWCRILWLRQCQHNKELSFWKIQRT